MARNDLPYDEEGTELKLKTHLPTTWLVVNRETGDVWRGASDGRWERYEGVVEFTDDH